MSSSSPDWIETAVAFLNEKVKDAKLCRECNSAAVELAPHVITTVLQSNEGISLGGPSYPQIMLICKNCGNTRYFNAMIVGALKPDAPRE